MPGRTLHSLVQVGLFVFADMRSICAVAATPADAAALGADLHGIDHSDGGKCGDHGDD